MNNGRAASFQDNSAHGEDAFLIRELSPTSALDVILDGVTHCEGVYASNFTAQVLQDAPIQSVSDLVDALEQAHSTLFQSGRGDRLLTTVSACLKIGDMLYVINAGDSPVYLIRGVEVSELTTIVRSQLFPGVVSGALGTHEKMTYEYKSVDLEALDWIILATDGLINNFFPREMADIVQGACSPDEAVSALGDEVSEKRRLRRGREDFYGTFKEDDQTAIFRYLG